MRGCRCAFIISVSIVITLFFHGPGFPASQAAEIGREVAIPRHLQDGEEFQLSTKALVAFGQKLFTANWTSQEGGGRGRAALGPE